LGGLRTSPQHMEATVEKFGMLDLTFEAVAPIPACPRASAKLLRDLELIDLRDEDSILLGLEDKWQRFLQDLVAESAKGQWIVKMLLQYPNFYNTNDLTKAPHSMPRVNPITFPERFLIKDACLTNCDQVWLFKHFHV